MVQEIAQEIIRSARKKFGKIKKATPKKLLFSILISYGKHGAFPDLFVFHSLGVIFHLG